MSKSAKPRRESNEAIFQNFSSSSWNGNVDNYSHAILCGVLWLAFDGKCRSQYRGERSQASILPRQKEQWGRYRTRYYRRSDHRWGNRELQQSLEKSRQIACRLVLRSLSFLQGFRQYFSALSRKSSSVQFSLLLRMAKLNS